MSPLNHDPEALRWAIGKSGLTQKQVADATGLSASYLSEMLKGTRNARPAVLTEIATVLNCPVVVLEAKRDASAGAEVAS